MQRRTLKAILDDVSYSCGASFEDIEFFDGLESVVLEITIIIIVAIQLKGCITLQNTMRYAIAAHLKMLAVKHQQMYIHCAVIV